jgi:hypothetical protein
VKFPGGEVVEQFTLNGQPEAATKGNYILLRPIHGYAAGLMDLATKKIVMANKLAAIDVYERFFVAERTNGEVGLYLVENSERVGVVALLRNPLGILRAAAVSPDFKWLAVSERSRGAVWNLTTGERVMHVRGFRGAHFAEDGLLYADFPKFEGAERSVARINPVTKEGDEGVKFAAGEKATQHGAYLLLTQPLKRGEDGKGVRLEMRDARTGASLWSKEFVKESPRFWMSDEEGTLVLAWATSSRAAGDEIKTDPRLTGQLAAMREKEGDYFLQVLDARTGSQLGRLLVETGKGSFHLHDVEAAGDWLVVSDSENRVLAYSVSTGEQKGRFFGDREAVSKAAGLLAVENERGQLSIYDLATGAKRDELTFPAAVSLARFSADGARLFVLAANQTAYVIDLGRKE